MKDIKRSIIAIDGPSAAGKSTIGKALANKYNLTYIDTGAMYRAFAWLAKSLNIPWSDERLIVDLIKTKPLHLIFDNNEVKVLIDDKDITLDIRTPEISIGASDISALPGVKKAMIEKQQEMGHMGGVVMDGRDIGTFVFPNADYKFYLDASLETRGLRRHNELIGKGSNSSLGQVISEMETRDYNDSNRAVAPLIMASDAIYINTENLNIQEVLKAMIDWIEKGV